MPKKKKIDPKNLLKMIDEGEEQKAILAKFGFKNSTQLKVAYANALMETGKAPEIKTRRGAAVETKPSKNDIDQQARQFNNSQGTGGGNGLQGRRGIRNPKNQSGNFPQTVFLSLGS